MHNTRALRCGRVLANFPTIIGKLAGMVDRFTTTLDCVDHTFIADDLLDRLPTPTQIGATRVGGVDLNKPGSGPRCPRSSRGPPHRAASPSPSSPPRSTP